MMHKILQILMIKVKKFFNLNALIDRIDIVEELRVQLQTRLQITLFLKQNKKLLVFV
jgi:hypothetical protein